MRRRPSLLPATVRRVPHLAQRRLGEEVIVLDLREAKLYGFNVAAGELLDWLKPGQALASLQEGAAADRASDLEAFVGLLLERGLVDGTDVVSEGREGALPLPPALHEAPPRLLWQEEVVRVTNQTSPPQAITNPQCLP